MNETRRLAEFIAGTSYTGLPEAVVEATRVYILDNLASGLLGSNTPWAEMVGSLARESASGGPCSVMAQGWTTSPSYAALVNGTMIGGFETDHSYGPGSCHPSAAVFPAVMAVAEREHLDGESFLASVALGYEAACRVGLAATRAVEDVAGFHGPGTNAPFGGAAGAGKALGLDAGCLTNALGIAGSHAGGVLEFAREGAMTKRIHVGRGSQMGLESALLAAKGFTGPSTILEGDRGYLKVYSPSPNPEAVAEGLGKRYLLLDVSLKAYACHGSFHSVIDSICRFRADHRFGSSDVESIKVAGIERMMEARFTGREPASVLGAQYSLPFSVAIALCRDAGDPLVFSETTLWDAQVRELARRIELEEVRPGQRPDRAGQKDFGEPGGPTAEITLTVSGSTHRFLAAGWKGERSDPYTYDEISQKFSRYAATFLPTGRIEEIITQVRGLERQQDVCELTRLLRAGSAITA
jgi:2-methylcitrate dehydratase PrpD